MMKPDWIKAIDEAIEAKQRIYAMTQDNLVTSMNNIQIRPMTEVEKLKVTNYALQKRVQQLLNDAVGMRAHSEALNSECNEMMFAIQSAMPWMILLGDYIGNGTKDDPMGRCNAILKMNNALGRNDEEAIESGRVDIR